MTAVILSGALFALRGWWMLRDSTLLQRRWVRVVPHLIDTILLLSAIALAVTIKQYPFVHGWLTAKVIALLGYIVLGTIALKRGRSKRVRALALSGAVALFAYIVVAATQHRPLPSLFELFNIDPLSVVHSLPLVSCA